MDGPFSDDHDEVATHNPETLTYLKGTALSFNTELATVITSAGCQVS